MGKWERSVWIIAVLLLVGALMTGGIGSRCDANDSVEDQIDLFMDVYQLINKYYVDKPVSKKILRGAIKGMMESLDDQHSYFMEVDKYKDFQDDIKGKFFGVGIEITIKNNILTVIAPIEGTPAYRAGLKPHDKIIKINGNSTKGKSIMDAVHQIRGERGTPVVLTIERDSIEEPFDVEVIRDEIKVLSVEWQMLENNIGYLRLKSFRMDATDEISKALEAMKGKGMRGLIFDLRGNPGGLLSAAVQIADFFVDDGIIVSTKGRQSSDTMIHRAHSSNTIIAKNIPVFLMINEGSASASEIVAGALQDSKRSLLYGTKSFGKASVQKLFPLRDNSVAVRLTIAKYYTPSGKLIHGNGIEPDKTIEPMTFNKDDKIGLKVFLQKKLMSQFLKKRKNAKYNAETIAEFLKFLRQNEAVMTDVTARYLLKRELILKLPLIDLEFDNQLQTAIQDMKKKLGR